MFALRRILLLAPIAALAACSVVAPPYSASVDNIQTLKNASPVATRLGAFTNDPADGNHSSVQLRANSMRSPVGDSFAQYLSSALQQELTIGRALSPDAKVELSGVLLKNNVDANIGTATGTISARFIVKRGAEVRYDSVKTATTQWDSSFAAAIAIPRATQEYPLIVQKLLASLYADPAFMQAIH
ncbi:hypothetical protein [Paraburkholderia nemoris]|jgi:hypothetical protein|uniref:Lipoprotein n=2 Tax=Paraburkholderia nemoris TaxID=2793076 RepID=A0ABN7M365_9BURK|nr:MULTISPECIES: hypothetical protein [Paraburkholderia]KPD19913.1 hypothetical protein ADM96_00900 [Burkholderia sp. ST111]MBK5147607.1 hypothetical protein [Burkholderia sp. R-69608]MBK3739575.1 hypothetical protein [Paraburkholderia aspalathi]MBK3812250.1 hypothetical protein [Paraburkholderia aspalathi]CAE6702032.1 hypothetical protein R69619_00693 [Paraburkholderia nemoris]